MTKNITHLKNIDNLLSDNTFSYHLVDGVTNELIGDLTIKEKYDTYERNYVTEVENVTLPSKYSEIKQDLMEIPSINWNIFKDMLQIVLKKNRINSISK